MTFSELTNNTIDNYLIVNVNSVNFKKTFAIELYAAIFYLYIDSTHSKTELTLNTPVKIKRMQHRDLIANRTKKNNKLKTNLST